MICLSCGKTIPDNAIQCPECGVNLLESPKTLEALKDYCATEANKIIQKRRELAEQS